MLLSLDLRQRILYLFFPISIITSFGIKSVSAAPIQPDENWGSVSLVIEPVPVVDNLPNSRQNNGDITETDSSIFFPLDENSNSFPELTAQITHFGILENLNIVFDSSFPPQNLQSIPILIAAPENFNPQLRLTSQQVSLPQRQPTPTVQSTSQPTPTVQPTSKPNSTTPRSAFVLESIQTGFRKDLNSSQQENQIIEPVFQFRLFDEKIKLKTAFNTLSQTKFASLTNIPIQLGWEGKTGQYNIKLGAGIDLFNRLPMALNFNAQIDIPIFVKLNPDNSIKSSLFLSAVVEQGPYKTSVKTLENQITATRSGFNTFWQIDPNTSFFGSYRVGLYNDGNFEQQIFNRLEHKWDEFWFAGNVFAWKYASDNQESSGYFSPVSSLVYNGEIGWGKNIFPFLNCRLNTTLGRQIVNGSKSGGTGYQTRCTVKISPNIGLDLGYSLGKSHNLMTGESLYNNQILTGQLQIKF
ncbi:MAG: hypothetical protein HCA25_27050 [Dolichospermum sp. DET50]|nr:hypothetical protein [Dolichospermum sp. DET66]MBS3035777.1 hypothetical protein [Dolichospermum sp. DET67]MBS3040979.1 hypothetical protein [Dolichospermum sp. DET50]QSX68083.1 MAG: hypothetical protein EZY12_26315 [Dolichospermum sp. DET69]